MDELLELRDTLTEIAQSLYGDWWVMNDKFWGSPTELQMRELEDKLYNLGYRIDSTPEQIKIANMLFNKINKL
jgi:hypothetical protein